MDVTARSHSRRWPILAVTGLGVAFAWFVLTLFAAPADAHADDGDGPLDTLAETVASVTTPVLQPVSESVTPVLEPVAPLITPVAETVAPVVSAVAPILEPLSPVGEAVAPVGQVVTAVVKPLAPVVQPVLDAIEPVTDAAAPALDAVTALPVVDHLVPSIPPLLDPPDAGDPVAPVPTPAPAPATPAAPTTGTATAGAVVSLAQAVSATAATRLLVPVAPVFAVAGTTVATLASSAPSPVTLPAVAPLDASTFFSSSTSSAGAVAVLAFGLLAAHRAWVLRRGPGDESALPGPALPTDVSPD